MIQIAEGGDNKTQMTREGDQNIRLRVLAAAGLAAGFASSHFEIGDVMRLTRN